MSRKHASPSSICHPSHLHQRILSLTPQQLLLWIRLHPACSTAVGRQQRMAHAWNSIGTWHGLLVPPGKGSMCSQAFLGVLCHLSQQHIRSAPRNSWQERSPDRKLCGVSVSKSSWAWLVPEPGTGLSVCVGGKRQPRGKPNKTA